MIDHVYDYDNQFFRCVIVSLTKTISKQIRWINRFEPTDEYPNGKVRVILPFYTSLTGEERFVFDLFVDDIADKRVTMNTDQLQRGYVVLTSFGSKSDEFANPNQYLSQKGKINDQLRRVISKVKAVPMNLNFDVEIQLATDNEVDKCSQRILDLLYNYMFFNFDYYGIKIDAILTLPDDKTVEIPREIQDLTGDRKRKIKFSLSVKTYYPIFKVLTDDLEVCDNDDKIDWESLGVPKPTSDFISSLKNYNAANGQMSYKGGTSSAVTYDIDASGNTISGVSYTSAVNVPEGMTEINRVYWEAYFQNYQNLIYKKPYDYLNNTENFNSIPTDPGDPPIG